MQQNFIGQREFLSRLPSIIAIAQRHGFDAAGWQEAQNTASNFCLKVPFIGAFSAGKTSLVNALLGEKIFSVQVTPETAIAAHVRQGADFSARLVRKDSSLMAVGADDLRQNRLADLGDLGSMARLEVQHPALTRWPRLVLVDLPGWGSGVEAHEQVIDEHAAQSLAYVLVVGAYDGGLRESLVRALTELAALTMPIILVVNKTDTRTPQDVQAVTQQIVREIQERSGAAPLATATTSARKNDIDALLAALDTLERRADERFAAGAIAPAVARLQGMVENLNLLAEKRFAEREAQDAEKEQLQAELAGYQQQQAAETQKLRTSLAPLQDVLRRRLLDGLRAQTERYAGLAETGGSVGDAMLLDARAIVAQTLREEYDPAVRRYLSALEQALPQHLPVALSLEKTNGAATPPAGSGAQTVLVTLATLSTALLPILSKHPVGRIVALVLPVLASLFGSGRDKTLQNIEEARARERLRNQVGAAVERVTQELLAHIGPQLNARITEAEQLVAQRIAHERGEREKVLATLEARINQGEAAAAQAREVAAQDRDAAQQHLSALQALVTQARARNA